MKLVLKSGCYEVGARLEHLGEGDNDGDNGRTFPEHPSPILHAPRNIISIRAILHPVDTHIYIYIYIFIYIWFYWRL